ncbi:uncharacterized protein LOC111050348 isoform X2 [Nilaparvata lugens]|uniref:uncharacterized protein LOC111050348 isoform X2 n=1 Tax=Nilaparvata lugens TaxID=108931 RepID=UPI00193D91DC|nr:uncharacterized protein LOC111050348 isoform X2 [Nilaparvata lugens]
MKTKPIFFISDHWYVDKLPKRSRLQSTMLLYNVRKLTYAFIAIVLLYVTGQMLRSNSQLDIQDRTAQLKQLSKLFSSGSSNSRIWRGQQACKHPDLDVYSPVMMAHIHKTDPIVCSPEKDWVEIDGSKAKITAEARQKHGEIECSFTDILRSNDFSSRTGISTTTHTEYNLENADFVRIHCVANDGKRWSNLMAGARHDQDVLDQSGWEKLPDKTLKLNVLMFGFDSLSRNTFIRKLPKSYDYLTKALKSIVLKGYNIVGDGTPQALIPILTGRTELELPDTRKRMGSEANYVNVYPFVWNDYHNNGYVTGYMEDTPDVGIFTFRLKGFSDQPTDYYLHTYYLDLKTQLHKHKPLCVGSMPRHKVMLDYARHIFTVNKERPKFVFGFHGEISHDSYNQVGAADDDLLEWMKWFNDEGHLNNTVLILMSDHGHRFAEVRNTQQGRLEERLPFFSFAFPPWFEKLHPEAARNFKINSERLTTPFDIHSTLMNILKFEGADMGDISQRSISLFKEVPKERSCIDAHIEPHWCACLDWEKIDPGTSIIQKAAKTLVDAINEYNKKYSNLCEQLSLNSVLWAAKLLPSKAVQTFKQSADMDGFVPDLSGKLEITMELYQIKISVLPGGGLFESSLTYMVKDDAFSLKIEEVSRINKYGAAARCIENTQEQLRKFCYCKDDA